MIVEVPAGDSTAGVSAGDSTAGDSTAGDSTAGGACNPGATEVNANSRRWMPSSKSCQNFINGHPFVPTWRSRHLGFRGSAPLLPRAATAAAGVPYLLDLLRWPMPADSCLPAKPVKSLSLTHWSHLFSKLAKY